MAPTKKTIEAKSTEPANAEPTAIKEVPLTIAQEVAKAMRESMPGIMAAVIPAVVSGMEIAKQGSIHEVQMRAAKAKLALEEKCSVCRQAVGDGKGRGCGGPWAREKNGDFKMQPLLDAQGTPIIDDEGKPVLQRIEDPSQFHVQMVVFPSDPIAERQFDGLQLNGAYYRSQGPGHKVWVPKQNDLAAMMLKFEEDQRIQQVGRKHLRQSGSIGKNGPQVNNPTFT